MQSREVEYTVLTVELSQALVWIINYLCWTPVGNETLIYIINVENNTYFIPSLDALSMTVSKINQNLSGTTAHFFFPAYMSLELCKTECEHNLKVYLVE